MRVPIVVPAHIVAGVFEGWSAAQLRGLGATLDAAIPDCARIHNGQFEWLEVNMTVFPDRVEFDPPPKAV